MNNQKLLLVPIMLTIAVVSALLVLSPSIIGNAQAQMYNDRNEYSTDYNNAYSHDDKNLKKSSGVNVQKIKCVNSNININGIDISQIPTDDLATAEAANEGADAIGAQNGNGNGIADKINFERNLVNICVNVNDNQQVNSPPANLLVTQTVTCDDPDQTRACLPLRESIRSDGFSIVVDGNNPNPFQFLGSAQGQNVVLGSGGYNVTETPLPKVADDVSSIEKSFGDIDITGPIVSFAGDCTQIGTSFSATGTILGGQSQTCEITNLFEIEEVEECISSDIDSSC